jgi:hypothetical protein
VTTEEQLSDSVSEEPEQEQLSEEATEERPSESSEQELEQPPSEPGMEEPIEEITEDVSAMSQQEFYTRFITMLELILGTLILLCSWPLLQFFYRYLSSFFPV